MRIDCFPDRAIDWRNGSGLRPSALLGSRNPLLRGFFRFPQVRHIQRLGDHPTLRLTSNAPTAAVQFQAPFSPIHQNKARSGSRTACRFGAFFGARLGPKCSPRGLNQPHQKPIKRRISLIYSAIKRRADGRTRTDTSVRIPDFESSASTISPRRPVGKL